MNSNEIAAAEQKPPEEIIVTLLVQEGNKPGQPIGSYTAGRRSHHLVFLPGDAPVGQQVRVRLVDTGSKDRRENTLYRGVPANVEYTDRWKDNGDGTASRVTVAKNWLLQEWEEGECERKTLGKDSPRPDRTTRTPRRTVDLSTSLSMATVQEEIIATTPLMSEIVDNKVAGGLVWMETGKSEVMEISDLFAVSKISLKSAWGKEKIFQVVWGADWPIEVTVHFNNTATEVAHAEATSWGKLPLWVQRLHESEYPVCACGRERVAAKDCTFWVDEYPKCGQCRAEEHCHRCGKQAQISFLSGRLICNDCIPYEKAEQLIASKITAQHRTKVIAEAQRLLAGQALPADSGFLVLKCGLDYVPEGWLKEKILGQYKGYTWYYFTDKGIFGSKFSPATLQVFRVFGEACGDGLVELVAWLTFGHKSDSDFFTKTQVKGEKAPLPDISDVVHDIAGGADLLSIRLRDSEQKRLEAVEAVKSLEELKGDEFRGNAIRLAEEALRAEAQDYAEVIRKVTEAKILLPPAPPMPLGAELAQAAATMFGHGPARSVFNRELTSSYGRSRRQTGVKEGLSGLVDTEIGQRFFALHRAADVDQALEDAVNWLDKNTGAGTARNRPPVTPRSSSFGGGSGGLSGGPLGYAIGDMFPDLKL